MWLVLKTYPPYVAIRSKRASTSLKVMDSSQSLKHSRDSCTSCARQSQPQYPTTGRGQTKLNFLPLDFLLFRTFQSAPLRGRQRERGKLVGRKKGRDHLGDTLPSDPSPYYHPECKSKTKQQRLISRGFALSVYCVYCKDHYIGRTTCTGCFWPLTLQLAGRGLFQLFKHSNGYIRMNHGAHNSS